MAARSGNFNKGLLVPTAHKALDNMKYEIASRIQSLFKRIRDIGAI